MSDLQFLTLAILAMVSLGLGASIRQQVHKCGDKECLDTIRREANSHTQPRNGDRSIAGRPGQNQGLPAKAKIDIPID